MGGMQASRAICGYPQRVPGEEQGHPSAQPPAMTYIVRPGDEEMPLPYAFAGLTIRSFPLEADVTRLQAMCDNYLEYRAAGGGRVPSAGRPGVHAGRDLHVALFEERSRGLLLGERDLVQRAGGPRPAGEWRWQAQDLAFYFPYIYVDNPWAIATGREVFGYPKAWSTLHIPPDPKHPAPVRLDTMVLPVLAKGTKLELLPLIEVSDAPGRAPLGMLHEVQNLGTGLEGLPAWPPRTAVGARFQPVREVIHAITEGRIPIVSLKQYRDCRLPGPRLLPGHRRAR